MDELTDIYKRIEYLRNNGVKMKEIADRVDMAPSVLSALYSSVLPAYIDLLKTRHFDVLASIPEPLLHSPEFIPRTLEAFAALKPLNRFLNFTIEQQLEQGGEFARSITHKA